MIRHFTYDDEQIDQLHPQVAAFLLQESTRQARMNQEVVDQGRDIVLPGRHDWPDVEAEIDEVSKSWGSGDRISQVFCKDPLRPQ